MSDKKLDLIMDMLVGLKTDVEGLKMGMQGLKSDMQVIKREQQQQGDVIHQLVKMVGENNKHHVKIMDELNTHEHNIEILNKNQLKLETEISKLKSR
ncbi:hypothetical protein GC093_17885 [Paenibacillus sp. LMG 31456]|uniref:Uncharacterized protein n=1 Tax=Paenibacillus foliorum TaxID=2654974 RepID=A0A972K1P9_9BACL|nr:hypothetical protein [Paenibacillus foliorum]NOU95080.1 hypothetical protein [Paenibacillus foliorum]